MPIHHLPHHRIRDLRSIAPLAAQEHAALERLAAGRGTEADLELAAQLYEEVGEGANAEELRRMRTMVTGESITDAEIRMLLDSPDASKALRLAARRALRVVERKGSNRARMAARDRCAAAYNARFGGEGR